MKHPASRTLFDHWLSLRRGRQVPDRNELDPVAIRGVLSYTFMLEVDGPRSATRTFPVRVSGTRLDALFGRSVKGTAFAALWQPRHHADLRSVAEAVLDEGRPAVIGGAAAPSGYTPTAMEMLMLPLRCQGQTHARLFCGLVPLTLPNWFGLERVEPLDLTTWRLIETTSDASTKPTAPRPQPSGVMRPRFAVIEGGRSPERPGAMPDLQSRIKAIVGGSVKAPQSNRSS